MPSIKDPAVSETEPPHLEDEAAWLRRQVVSMRTALRFVIDPRVKTLIREFIVNAEDRLVALEQRTDKKT
jgi:hypothetical protein